MIESIIIFSLVLILCKEHQPKMFKCNQMHENNPQPMLIMEPPSTRNKDKCVNLDCKKLEKTLLLSHLLFLIQYNLIWKQMNAKVSQYFCFLNTNHFHILQSQSTLQVYQNGADSISIINETSCCGSSVHLNNSRVCLFQTISVPCRVSRAGSTTPCNL